MRVIGRRLSLIAASSCLLVCIAASCQLVYPTDGFTAAGSHDAGGTLGTEAGGDSRPAPGPDAIADAIADATICMADTTADPQNCGACTHGCQGGACEAGVCQPIVLATGQSSPAELAVDDTYVYWVNYELDGGVMRVKKDGSCTAPSCAIRLANGGNYPVDIAVDDASVYWVTQGLNGALSTIRTTSKTGDGGVVTLASTGGPSERLVVDDTYVYWGNALPGDAGVVYSVPKTGPPTSPRVRAMGQNTPGPVAVDEGNLYWVNQGTGSDASNPSTEGAVLTIGKNGTCLGEPCPLPLVSSLSSPFVLKVDDASVYWTERSQYAVIMSAPKSTPSEAGTALYSEAVASINRVDLALGPSTLFFNYRTAGGNVYSGGKDGRCPSSPTCPHLLASDQAFPQGIAVDATSVYWTDFVGGQILKVAQ